MTTTTTIGVVSVDYDEDEARCSIHGRLDSFDAERAADRHILREENCWGDHCGGDCPHNCDADKGCALSCAWRPERLGQKTEANR